LNIPFKGIVDLNKMKNYSYYPFRSNEARDLYLSSYDEKAKLWPVASETKLIDTRYGKTFVRRSGEDDAPTLILLPGAASTSLMWLSSITELAKHYNVYAVDNIYDVGRSINTHRINDVGDFIRWLDELFTSLDLEHNINLAGYSYGGWLTAKYALAFPERLNKIILLAPSATVLPFQWQFLSRVILLMIPNRYFVKRVMYWLFEDSIVRHETGVLQVDEFINEIMLIKKCYEHRKPVNPTTLGDDEWRGIQVPTLLLLGENEKLYAARKAVRRLKAVAPQIDTEVFPDSGHDFLFIQQEQVMNKVINFLDN